MPAPPFDQTAYQKKTTNVEGQHVPMVYKGDKGTQHPASQISTFSKYQSQSSTSSNDNLPPNYFQSYAEYFGNKIKQKESSDSSDTAYSDKKDNSATHRLDSTQHVKFPDTQPEFSPSIKQWEGTSQQKPRPSTAEVKQR
jgi:hypothetical protein